MSVVDPVIVAPPAGQGAPKSDAWRRLRRNPTFLLGAGVFLLILAVAIFAPLLAPYDPYSQSMSNRVVPPVWMDRGSWDHVLGTDGLGRDYLSRIIYGARISLLIAVFTVITSGLIGTTLGVLAGYFGGKIDLLINFFIMTRLTLPVVMVALAVVALFGGSLTVVVLVLGFLLWDRFAVVTRSATQQLRNQEYIQASRSLGFTTRQIIFRDVLPNIFDRLAVIATFEMAQAILLEAALSFLGLGVQPPTPSWGLMVAEGRQFLLFDPWLIMIPGAAIFVLVMAINLAGDGLRDAMAPENRN
ncbi:ABC transporter permease [Aurantimonas endophytica]|uniref:Peptide/nickel transport system permease protein n=1 Tax=Aurantimonas endophytica TaxID=1522175 RepID=A0A7W6MR08_9HYPH|nr:ABC transporter permease [Aurantimonas endophytica]MBB4004562.1 peptide/nickel transport system permease protein [Aurantimonas endophytica]MCO6405398.1 ABC transporter permease subunit [Aurantimonas endophytica]